MTNYTKFEGVNLITYSIKKTIIQFFLRVFVISILCFGIFYEDALASNSYRYSKKECLKLTENDVTYDNATKRILKLKTVSEFKTLLEKNKPDKLSLVFFSSEPRYIKDKCFWYIRLEENHETHMVFWKSLLVDVSGANIYEENADSDSYSIIK